MLSDRYDTPIEICAGIVAALSPACSWIVNKRQAEDLISAHHDGINLSDVPLTTYGRQGNKAIELLTGFVVDIPTSLGHMAYKTRAFYDNILDPDTSILVTIDRRILRAAGMQSNKTWPALYKRISMEIVYLAYKNKIKPCQVQAVIWQAIGSLRENTS